MYKQIFKYLFKTYFQEFSGHSEVTSSHWRMIGKQNAGYENGNLNLKGDGFGEFIPSSLTNRFKTIPKTLLSLQLLRKYDCPDTLISLGRKITKQQERVFVFDCAKQILSVFWILKGLKQEKLKPQLSLSDHGIKTVCVIGDGYGYMGILLKKLDPKIKLVSINLGRTLLFDVFYTQKLFPTTPVALLSREWSAITEHSIHFMEAEKYHLLSGLPIDLFINISSMQEMKWETIHNYFRYMRNSSANSAYFYCCNRLEKRLPNGEISSFFKYPWSKDDDVLLDELCPWYQKFPVSMPPFWRRFDGPHQHRLVRLQKN